jgi:hypothetical protein
MTIFGASYIIFVNWPNVFIYQFNFVIFVATMVGQKFLSPLSFMLFFGSEMEENQDPG